MFTLSHTMPVNTEKPSLNQAQIWQGLLLKAENPVPFLDAMSACTVIDRGDNWLLRNFNLRGEEMQERVTFEPKNRVTFERTKSSAMGTILNEIVTLDDGDMGLRFTFTHDVDGLVDGSRTAPPQSAPTAPSKGDRPDGSATTDQTERESS